jgi:hypothetical protein
MSNEGWLKKMKDYKLPVKLNTKIIHKDKEKKFCKGFEAHIYNDDEPLGGLCINYKGSRDNIESCAYRCGKKIRKKKRTAK